MSPSGSTEAVGNDRPTRILVVDDSALYRQSIRNVLRSMETVEVVGAAENGIDALEKIESLRPDLLTLDLEMPDMDGIQLLREIRRRRLPAKAIMVSSFTHEGAAVTTQALMEGAFDFLLKPSGKDAAANRQLLSTTLGEKIDAYRQSLQDGGTAGPAEDSKDEDTPISAEPCQLVIIGTSTGGPAALKAVLPKLPKDLPVPVVVVQHMPETYTRSLANRLNDACPLEVVEAENMMQLVPGRVIVAAGGKQMQLIPNGKRTLVRLKDDPPEHGVRPSVDYVMRSAAKRGGGGILAVVLTGMGRDGLDGCRQLREAGGVVFAQCQSDCVVYGMPKAVIDAGLANRILPLGKVAPAIVRHLKRSRQVAP